MTETNQASVVDNSVVPFQRPIDVIPAYAKTVIAETVAPYLKEGVQPMHVVAAIENNLCRAGVKKASEAIWSGFVGLLRDLRR